MAAEPDQNDVSLTLTGTCVMQVDIRMSKARFP
jgi:hypothetical protein